MKESPMSTSNEEVVNEEALVPAESGALRPRDAMGKFVPKNFQAKKKEAVEKIVGTVTDVMNMTMDELEPKPGDTVLVAALKRNWREAMDQSSETANLAAKAKFIESQMKAAGVFEPTRDEINPIRIVIFSQPDVPFGTDHQTIPKPTEPSWAKAEVVEEGSPQHLDTVDPTDDAPEPSEE
jgi:hypothetical protein